MVKGIGIDIIEIARIRQSVEKLGDQFLQRIFTQSEIDYCKKKQNVHQHLAARFATKEAVSKALSTGWRGDFSWKDVEVMNDKLGQPHITLYGTLREKLTGISILVSISHSEHHVAAMVVMEG